MFYDYDFENDMKTGSRSGVVATCGSTAVAWISECLDLNIHNAVNIQRTTITSVEQQCIKLT